MSIVTLISGGLDSTLAAKLAQEEGVYQHPLFINYGQRAISMELAACRRGMASLGLPEPRVVGLHGFGDLIRSGLTDENLHVVDDAFTPGRNLLFLLIAAAHAYQIGADAISIGLLHEDSSLFPDQTAEFLREAERIIALSLGRRINVLAPLAYFHKRDVIDLAHEKGIDSTYSCHSGYEQACGECIACNEFNIGGS